MQTEVSGAAKVAPVHRDSVDATAFDWAVEFRAERYVRVEGRMVGVSVLL